MVLREAKRPGIWTARLAEARGRAEVNVAKQRHGPTGEVTLAFDGAFTKFSVAEGRPMSSAAQP